MPGKRVVRLCVGVRRSEATIVAPNASHVLVDALMDLVTQRALQRRVLLLELRLNHILYPFDSLAVLIDFLSIEKVALLRFVRGRLQRLLRHLDNVDLISAAHGSFVVEKGVGIAPACHAVRCMRADLPEAGRRRSELVLVVMQGCLHQGIGPSCATGEVDSLVKLLYAARCGCNDATIFITRHERRLHLIEGQLWRWGKLQSLLVVDRAS